MRKVLRFIFQIENIEIEGNGSTLIFHGDFASFLFNKCKNIKLKNLTIDYYMPTCVEMYVEKIEDNTVYYRIPEIFSYEINNKEIIWTSEKSKSGEYYWTQKNSFNAHSITVFDLNESYSKRYVLEDGPFHNIESIEKTDSAIKIHYSKIPNAIRENIMLALNASNNRDNAGFAIVESSNIEFDNVEFNYLHGFGLLVQMSENISFNDCKFIGNERHMVSSFADSIHVSGCKGKVTINNCVFDASLDDSINIHGTFTRVESIDKNSAILRYVHPQQAGFQQFFVGNQVEFIDSENLTKKEDKFYKVKSVTNPGQYSDDLQFMKVEFTEALPDYLREHYNGLPRYVAENISYTPSVEIKNSTFSNVPSRAILCTSRKKVKIENNDFNNITMASIYISNDANEWYESGSVNDLSIVNNRFTYTDTFLDEIDTKSIWINPIISDEIKSVVHRNIKIKKNYFELDESKALVYRNVDKLEILNNKFKK